jgi:hypothetical protein
MSHCQLQGINKKGLNMKIKTCLIKNGKGEIKGKINLYWSKQLGWVSVPKK